MSSKHHDKNAEYEVEEILGHRKILGALEYQIKWKGFSHSQNTWEPKENLTNAKKLLNEYKKENNLDQNESEVVQKKAITTDSKHKKTRGQAKESEQINKFIKSFTRKMKINKDSSEEKTIEKEDDQEEEYEIEEIVQSKQKKGKTLYEIKWKNFTSAHNTWEPEDNLGHASILLQKFKNSQEKNKRLEIESESESECESEDEKKKQKPNKKQKKLPNLKFQAKTAKKLRKICGLKLNEKNEIEFLVEDEWFVQKKLKKEEIQDIKKVQLAFEEYLKKQKK